MTNLQAALGLGQLERLDSVLQTKRRIGLSYTQGLQDCPHLSLPLSSVDYADNLFWVYGLVYMREPAEHLTHALATQFIGTRPFFWPIHLQPVFVERGLFRGVSAPVSERLARHGFYLPSGLAVTEQQLKKVVACLLQLLA